MIKVGIIGATGYTGIELLRLLKLHPAVKLEYAGTESHVGTALSDVYPHLKGLADFAGQANEVETIAANCDVIFCALPHGHAMNIVPKLWKKHKKVIDLGADFRIKDPAVFSKWYHHSHTAPELLCKAVYGLPEAGYREAIKTAQLVANPGCYPTASSLAARPLLQAGIIDVDHCIFDAKSGISGAGKTPSIHTHFCEVAENFSAYQVGGKHRHIPEIEQVLSQGMANPIMIQFTPHLIPITRGMMVTSYFKLNQSLHADDIAAIYQEAYAAEPFIRLRRHEMPQVKQVIGSNFCDIGFALDARTHRLTVISVIDNLLKGASGQAVQNMNLMCGFAETLGLELQFPIYP